MGKQRQVITREMIEIITEKAIEVYNQQKDIDEKERFDKRLNNTRLLLEHYRDFTAYENNAVYNIYKELEEDWLEVVELMEGKGNDKIESIEKAVLRTKTIMNHVDIMIDVYKQICNKSQYPEDKRRYRVIEGLYLKEPAETVQEIADKEFISERTVYKDVRIACRRLTVLIFGIEGFYKNKSVIKSNVAND